MCVGNLVLRICVAYEDVISEISVGRADHRTKRLIIRLVEGRAKQVCAMQEKRGQKE